MITRIWHGRTKSEQAERYLQFLLQDGTLEYLETEGNRSVNVWTKSENDVTHFWTVSEWSGIDAIKRFAGNEYEKARYYAEDDGVLLEFEEGVAHYESYDASNAKVKEYIRQLSQLYNGGSWQGESISGKLKSLTAEEAFQQPFPGVHSVAEIVWHCIYWRRVFLKRLEGDQLYRDETIERLNFLPVSELQEKGWEDLLAELEQTQTVILRELEGRRDRFLKEAYQPGYTFDYLVEGLVHHDVYHLGQIGLVIRIIRSKAQI